MSFDSAFRPAGNTVLVVATSSVGQTPTQWSTGNMSQAFIANPSGQAVFIAFGSSTAAAGIPTTGTPTQGLCMASTLSRVFSIGPNNNAAWISAVTTGGSVSFYVTPGVGF